MDDYVKIPDDESLKFGTGDFSYSLWFKANSISPRHCNQLLCKRDNRGDYEVQIDSNRKIRTYSGGILDSTTIINPGTYYFVSVVRSNGKLYLYINGIIESSTIIPQNANVNSDAPLGIGRDLHRINKGLPEEYFNGIIDEVRIYNRALSEGEIKALYKEVIPTPTGEITKEAGGLNIKIKYPKRVLVGEMNNIIVELTTKDFENPGYPDLENNIFDGVIKIASDESMNRGDINLFMCPNKLGDLGPKPINWPNKPQYYKYEDLIDSQVGEIDMQIFETLMRILSVVPIANFPFGMYDVLHWDPSSIAEATKEKYTEGQAPTDIYFYDENNYDCWEHSWNFNYYASNVVSENGVKLVFPFYFEEPGTKRVAVYIEVNYELFPCFGIVWCKKLGKTYDFEIEVLSE